MSRPRPRAVPCIRDNYIQKSEHSREESYSFVFSSDSEKEAKDGEQLLREPSFMQAQTVVVVGAGISGLQVARALLKRGQHPLVIEQGEAVGGVWTNKAYQGLNVQGKWLAAAHRGLQRGVGLFCKSASGNGTVCTLGASMCSRSSSVSVF
jgi:NADPH-dependent 2,4-dienoyl-CoA reductase/sulfur reductase-like enzyme